MILRQTNRHSLTALLTADREIADAVCVHIAMADDGGRSGIRQLVCDLQSNDDSCFLCSRFGEDFNFHDAFDVLRERESSDCRSPSGSDDSDGNSKA
jgi:hypothetical protein